MSLDYCYGFMCFVPLDANAPKFFGFSEFLAGLALMVLAWTIADIRYRFRVRTAPLPLQAITFTVVSSVGILTLLTDLWRAEQWLVPRGNLLTPSMWQAFLGGIFLLTFLTWAWFAFIRPPVFGKRNAQRYAQTLYGAILKGNPSELSIIADEFAYSVRSLVHYATDKGELKNYRMQEDENAQLLENIPQVTAYSNDILLLIADKRFCRAIVEFSPGTALAVFNEINETQKYGIQVEVFAKNIVNEALVNKDSFLFHEVEGYESGLIGYHKPLSQAMFSNYKMAEVIGTLLDPDWDKRKWDAAQWTAYCRTVLMVFRDYVDQKCWSHSFVLYRATGYIEHAVSDLYTIDGVANSSWDDDVQARLRVIVEFIKDAIEILDRKAVPEYIQLRVRENSRANTFYDRLASMIFEIIFSASAVRSPYSQSWLIQHNFVWGELFNFNRLDGAAARVVKFKVRRLIYNEVIRMNKFPNFKGARILSFCLNVMGLCTRGGDSFRDSNGLHKAILAWTKNNYAALHTRNPRVAEACLINGITYEKENLRLVKTLPADGLRTESEHIYLDLLPPNS